MKKINLILLAAIIIPLALGGLYAFNPAPVNWTYAAVYSSWKTPNSQETWVKDLDVDYERSKDMVFYGVWTNSEWLVKWMSVIVPMIQYEGLTPKARYPEVIMFAPFPGTDAVHVLGRYIPQRDMVLINDAYVDWNNSPRAALLLATITHELIHAQGGAFISGQSVDLEARTEAATIEVLAGLCNYRYELACEAFWNEVEGYAMTKIRLAYPAYWKFLSGILNPTDADYRAQDKSLRFWANNQESLQHIITAYTINPWRDLIIPAAEGTQPFQTGWLFYDSARGRPARMVANFDDIAALLGWMLNLLH